MILLDTHLSKIFVLSPGNSINLRLMAVGTGDLNHHFVLMILERPNEGRIETF